MNGKWLTAVLGVCATVSLFFMRKWVGVALLVLVAIFAIDHYKGGIHAFIQERTALADQRALRQEQLDAAQRLEQQQVIDRAAERQARIDEAKAAEAKAAADKAEAETAAKLLASKTAALTEQLRKERAARDALQAAEYGDKIKADEAADESKVWNEVMADLIRRAK